MEIADKPESLGMSADRLEKITDWMNRYVDSGKLAGAQTLVARRGKPVYSRWVGKADMENNIPWNGDTIARFYSMSKPVTSVALMTLYEKALFHLDDPIEEFIPSFKDMRYLRPQARSLDDTEPVTVKPTVHHLLTHQSGMTYGFNGGVLGDAYVANKIDFGGARGTLEEQVDRLAELPLQFNPGSRWNYGVSTDVAGRLVEVISGQPLDRFLQENIFDPLGMEETSFEVPKAKQDRFAALYGRAEDGSLKLVEDPAKSIYLEGKPTCFSGGGGLVSTAADYFKFAEMMRKGGALQNHRVLGSRTVEFMTENHLEGDLADNGQPVFSEVSFEGVGFGLCGWVMLDPPKSQMMGTPGDFGWGGMASTVHWVDPVEDLTIIYLTQLMPSSLLPLRKELRALVHQSLID